MFGGLGHEKGRSTAIRVVTAVSCTAAFVSVVTTEPGQNRSLERAQPLSCSQANPTGTEKNWRHFSPAANRP